MRGVGQHPTDAHAHTSQSSDHLVQQRIQCPGEFPEGRLGCRRVAPGRPGRAPVGMPGSRSATSARSRRLVRLRTTAPPTALDTTKPTRGGWPARASVWVAWTTSSLDPARRPPEERTADVKSARSRSRFGAGSTADLRRRARSGPCGDERRGCCDPHGCASADGSRGSWPGGGCSAGKSACSRCSLICMVGWWARVVGEPVAVGCHRKPMTFAGKQRPRGRGSRACENSRTTGPLTVRESGHGGQTSGMRYPGLGENALGSHGARPVDPGATHPSASHAGIPTTCGQPCGRGHGYAWAAHGRSTRCGIEQGWGREWPDATMTQLWRTTLEVARLPTGSRCSRGRSCRSPSWSACSTTPP